MPRDRLSLGPVRLRQAASAPLGDQTQFETPFLSDDTRLGALPPMGITQSCARPPADRRAATVPVSSGARDEMNETALPSGSQRGELGDQLSSTRIFGATPPSVEAIQICGIRRF